MDRPITNKVVLFFGHATFITLAALAWKHADLRTTFGDSAYQIFKWVNDAGLNVEAHRYSAIFPQLTVKFFKFLQADLKTLLLVASVTHVLVAYAIFLICLLWLKAPRSAMAAALAAVLCTRLTFYGPVLEANYLLSYPFLFFALLERNGREQLSVRTMMGLVLAATLTLFVHPLGWLVLVFGTVFFWSVGRIGTPLSAVISIGLFVAAMMVRFIFPPTAYEVEQYAHLRSAFSGLGVHEHWASWDFLLGHTFTLTTNYLPALIVFIVVVYGFGKQKERQAAVIVLAGVCGFITLETITFRNGDVAIMMDRAYLPVATLIALPAVHLLWEQRGRWVVLGAGMLVLCLFIKLRDVSFGSRTPGKQLASLEQLMQEMRDHGVSKCMIDKDGLVARGIDANWALPFSSLLISSWEGPARSLIIRSEEGRTGRGLSDEHFSSPELDLSTMALDRHYFQLKNGPFIPFDGMTELP